MNNSKSKEEKEEEEDDDIIINDDFDEETVVVKSMTVDLFKSKSLSLRKEEKGLSEEMNKKKHESNVVDTKDVDSELPFDTKLVYQDKTNVSKEEYETKNKLTIDQVQSEEYNEPLLNLNKEENEKKRKLDEKISIETHSTITTLLLELEAKNERINQLEEKILFLNNTLDTNNIKVHQLHGDIERMTKLIQELIGKNKKLEEDLQQQDKNWKNHISNTKTISACNKSLIKIEKQLATSFDQINRLTNENFLLKQTIHKLYSSPYSKINLNLTNQVSLNSTLTTNPTNEKEISGMPNNNTSTSDNKPQVNYNNTLVKKNNQSTGFNHSKSSTTIPSKQSVSRLRKNKEKQLNNISFDISSNRSNSYHIETAMKESKILEIESTLYKLQKERDKLNDELCKLPELPKVRSQITKKKLLESSIEEYIKKISANKQKIAELNGV